MYGLSSFVLRDIPQYCFVFQVVPFSLTFVKEDAFTTCHLLYIANETPRNATVHGREEGQTRYVGKYSPPPLCFAMQNIGEVARSDGGVCCDKGRLGNGKRFLYRRLVNDPFAPMTLR